jgi:hypothetical protein
VKIKLLRSRKEKTVMDKVINLEIRLVLGLFNNASSTAEIM